MILYTFEDIPFIIEQQIQETKGKFKRLFKLIYATIVKEEQAACQDFWPAQFPQSLGPKKNHTDSLY